MPWTTKSDVARHNKHAANDPSLRKLWKKVANKHLEDHPDDKASAIKIANGVVRKRIHESLDETIKKTDPKDRPARVPSRMISDEAARRMAKIAKEKGQTEKDLETILFNQGRGRKSLKLILSYMKEEPKSEKKEVNESAKDLPENGYAVVKGATVVSKDHPHSKSARDEAKSLGSGHKALHIEDGYAVRGWHHDGKPLTRKELGIEDDEVPNPEKKEVNESESLNEFNGLGNMAKNIANKTMGALGSASAQGRYQAGMGRDHLANEFYTFMGHQGQKQPTYSVLLDFLKNKYGEQFAANIGQSIIPDITGVPAPQAAPMAPQAPVTGAPPAAANAAPPTASAPAAAPKDDLYANKGAQVGNRTSNTNYQGNTFKQLNDLVTHQINMDPKQVMSLTRELYQHAADNGGADKARVFAYLKNLRKNPRIMKDPKLQQMFSGLKLESIHRVLDMAMYLVEHEIKTKIGLNEAYNRFFLTEKPNLQQAPNKQYAYPRAKPMAPARNSTPQPASPPPAPVAPTKYTTGKNTYAPSAVSPNDALRARYANNPAMQAKLQAKNAAPQAGNAPNPAPQADPNQMAAPQASSISPNQPLSKQTLDKIFTTISRSLLAQNKMSVVPKQQQNGGGDYYAKQKNGRYKPVKATATIANQTATNSAPQSTTPQSNTGTIAPVDMGLLDKNLRAKKVDQRLIPQIASMIRRNGGKVDDRAMTGFLRNNPQYAEAMKAISDAELGRASQPAIE